MTEIEKAALVAYVLWKDNEWKETVYFQFAMEELGYALQKLNPEKEIENVGK